MYFYWWSSKILFPVIPHPRVREYRELSLGSLIFEFGLNYSGAAIDLSTLRIVDGKTCWVLCIDGLVLSSDGNLLDALSIAVKVFILLPFSSIEVHDKECGCSET